jgi:Fe-S oxidoreductase/nitrate reductase gamma subunit
MLSSFDMLLFVASVLTMLWGFIRRYRMWKQGKSEGGVAQEQGRKIGRVLLSYFDQRKVLEDRYAGISHLFIFWGVIVTFIVVMIAQLRPTMPLWLARGLSLLLDVVGVFALLGTVMLLMKKHGNEHERRYQKNSWIHLWILLCIVLTGFFAEGQRLSLTGEADTLGNIWSPIGSVVSYFIPPSPILLKLLIRIHLFLVLLFLALLPFSAMRHIITASLSIYYKEKKVRGRIKLLSLEAGDFGAGSVQQFTYTQLLSVDACMNCGRCDKVCPPRLSGHPLSPQNIVRHIQGTMENMYLQKGGGYPKNGRLLNEQGMIGEEDMWCCTTCMACSEICPAYVEQLAKIIDIRRYTLLAEGKYYPPEYKQLFRNIEIFGDALGKGRLTKEDWASEINLKKIYQYSKTDILLWVGCIGALYDEHSKEVIIGSVRILEKAGVNFGILGKEELCCGDFARRMGNEYLFQKLANKNIMNFKKYKIREIVTLCPHCFNVLRNDYKQFDADFNVRHITQVINDFIQEGKIKINSRLDGLFTYHDPCYLGRYNDIYQAPRDILKAILNSEPKEMAHSKAESLCCGAGGGNFWRKGIVGKRMEEVRVEEAALIKADAIVTACPFCKIMFDSGIKQKDFQYQPKVMDIIDAVTQTC